MIVESETEVDTSYMISILEERLGDFHQIAGNYDAVILPVSMKPEGDLLSPNTSYIKGLIKENGLKPVIAKKDSSKYIAAYSIEAIYPQLLILKDATVTIILAVFANYVYDTFIKSHKSNETITISYIQYDIGNNKFVEKKIEGPAQEVVKLLGHNKE